MDEIIKRQMKRLSNFIIALCVLTLLVIMLFKKPAECSCTQVSVAPKTRVNSI